MAVGKSSVLSYFVVILLTRAMSNVQGRVLWLLATFVAVSKYNWTLVSLVTVSKSNVLIYSFFPPVIQAMSNVRGRV